MHERARAQEQVEAVTQELQAARNQIVQQDIAYAELTAFLDEHKKTEMERLPEPPMEIFKMFKRNNLVASMRRRPSTIAARVRVFTDLRFEEVKGIEASLHLDDRC
jgi:enamine deaminase RidA (YjgF/YER057c/UK114 family)